MNEVSNGPHHWTGFVLACISALDLSNVRDARYMDFLAGQFRLLGLLRAMPKRSRIPINSATSFSFLSQVPAQILGTE